MRHTWKNGADDTRSAVRIRDQDEGAGMDNVKRFASVMRAHGHDFELQIYKDVGHSFMAASRFHHRPTALLSNGCQTTAM